MSNKKHYIITSITLGAIAAVAAGVIGLTNLVTEKRIKDNELKRIQNGIAEIFGENAEILEEFTISDNQHQYLVYGYKIKNSEEAGDKYAIRTSGYNMYGKVSLLVGVEEGSDSFAFKRLTIVVNEQTYASTLEDEYIDPLNNGGDIDDVECGATYGAKLVRDMVNETIDYANTVLSKDGD